MTILGIDPGLASCGYGVVRVDSHKHLAYGTHGCIRTSSTEPLAARLVTIYAALEDVIAHHGVTDICCEDIFFAKNTRSALLVSRVCGIIALLAGRSSLPFAEYTPLQIKQATACYGRADKSQVMHMVQLLLHIPDVKLNDHEADALAAAVCHAHSYSG